MSKLLGYRFKVSWTPGKTQCIADALSRSPVFEAEETQDVLMCAALETHGGSRIKGEPVLDPALEKLTKHAVNDTAYQKVHEAVKGSKTPTTYPPATQPWGGRGGGRWDKGQHWDYPDHSFGGGYSQYDRPGYY